MTGTALKAWTRLMHLGFLLTRPALLGVRIIVHDRKTRSILLVRHGYVPGWHLPGGGVEAGRTAMETVRTELLEETGLTPTDDPALFGIYLNRSKRRDHILLYVCETFERQRPFAPNWEIAELRWLPIAELECEATPATQRRVAEWLGRLKPTADW